MKIGTCVFILNPSGAVCCLFGDMDRENLLSYGPSIRFPQYCDRFEVRATEIDIGFISDFSAIGETGNPPIFNGVQP